MPRPYVQSAVRTTVQLDPQLVAEAKKAAAASGRTLDAVIEDALRETLDRRTARRSVPAGEIPTFRGRGLQPGVDLDNSAALLELMENDRDSRRRQHPHLRTPRRRG
jgi:predicted transcriptional regulator